MKNQKALFWIAICLATIIAYSAGVSHSREESKPVTAAEVQPNISQSESFDIARREMFACFRDHGVGSRVWYPPQACELKIRKFMAHCMNVMPDPDNLITCNVDRWFQR